MKIIFFLFVYFGVSLVRHTCHRIWTWPIGISDVGADLADGRERCWGVSGRRISSSVDVGVPVGGTV